MCKICALAARYTPVRQDSLVFNLSQFATVVTAKPLIDPSQNPPVTATQEKPS
jgi:hypothetical protein